MYRRMKENGSKVDGGAEVTLAGYVSTSTSKDIALKKAFPDGADQGRDFSPDDQRPVLVKIDWDRTGGYFKYDDCKYTDFVNENEVLI